MNKFKITIYNHTPSSINYFLFNSRMKPVYEKECENWYGLIKRELERDSIKIENPIKKARITITIKFYKSNKRQAQNFCGFFIISSLVKLGVLKSNDLKNIEVTIKGLFGKGFSFTEIEIEDLEGLK